MTKKFASMFLALVMCLSLSAPAFAMEQKSDDDRIYLGTIVFSDLEESTIVPYADNFTSEITVLDSNWDSVCTVPTGQPSGGYRFHGAGGSVYVNTSGGIKITAELTAAWTYKGKYSVSVSVGAASTSNVGGICVNIPADGNYYRVELEHNYLLEHLQVVIFNNGVLMDVQDRTQATLKSIDIYAVKV